MRCIRIMECDHLFIGQGMKVSYLVAHAHTLEGASVVGDIRNGKGHRAYRRKQAALKRRTAAKGLVCTACGGEIDTTLPSTDRMSFTADHPQALGAGGHLVKQGLEPMHRSCNARKSDHAEPEIWEAS